MHSTRSDAKSQGLMSSPGDGVFNQITCLNSMTGPIPFTFSIFFYCTILVANCGYFPLTITYHLQGFLSYTTNLSRNCAVDLADVN